MANEFRYGIDQNGVRHPVCDDTRVDWASYAVLGAKNFLNPTLTTYTPSGTVTVNADNTVTLSGTFTSDVYIPVFNKDVAPALKQGAYLVSGGVAETSNYKFYIQERNADNTGWGNAYYDTTGNGVLYERNSDVHYAVFIWVKSGTNFATPLTFKPMIRLASDPDSTYAPYAMTNEELTKNKADFASIFMPYSVKPVYTGDLNNLPTGCIYVGENATNSPIDWCIVYTVGASVVDMPSATYGFQLAIGVANQGMYYRRKISGSWTGWNQITMTAV